MKEGRLGNTVNIPVKECVLHRVFFFYNRRLSGATSLEEIVLMGIFHYVSEKSGLFLVRGRAVSGWMAAAF